MTAIDAPSVFKNRIDSLNPDFRFDNFIAGEKNDFVFQLTRLFAKDKQAYGKKILIIAKTGLGKTHLAQSFCRIIAEAEKKFIYLTGNAFVSAKKEQVEKLQQELLNCEAFVLDGIHFLKEDRDQLLFLSILKELAEREIKVVLTSSIFPEKLKLPEELESVIAHALRTKISYPDSQTISKIIVSYAKSLELLMPENIITYLSHIPIRNIHQLIGILENIKTRTSFCPSVFIKETVGEVLELYFPQRGETTPKQILETVCVYFKTDIQMIKSRSRKKIYSLPRRIYFRLCRQLTNETLKSIGELVNRNHSSVLYSINKISRECKKNLKIERILRFLEGKLKGEIFSF